MTAAIMPNLPLGKFIELQGDISRPSIDGLFHVARLGSRFPIWGRMARHDPRVSLFRLQMYGGKVYHFFLSGCGYLPTGE